MSYNVDYLYGPYAHLYYHLYEHIQEKNSYDFGEAPVEKYSPPVVQFSRPLKWWSMDRPERLKVIRHIRDHYLHEILKIGNWSKPFYKTDRLKEQRREKEIGCKSDNHARISSLGVKKISSIHTTGEWAA